MSPSKSYSLFRLYSPTNRRSCIHGLLVTFVSYIGNEDAYVGNRFVLNDVAECQWCLIYCIPMHTMKFCIELDCELWLLLQLEHARKFMY